MEVIKKKKEFKELLTKLQELKIIQTKGDWAENLPDEIWEQYFKNNFKEIKHGLDIDTHRWYEVSTTVIKILDGLLGITFITNMFSENQNYEDCYVAIEFAEMEEIQTVSYQPTPNE